MGKLWEAVEWFYSPVKKRLSFKRIYQMIGEEKWNRLLKIYNPGYYTIDCSEILSGKISFDGLIKKYQGTDEECFARRKDYISLLGIVPLPETNTRGVELLRRYQVLQDFYRKAGSKKNYQKAARYGISYLAETAGF